MQLGFTWCRHMSVHMRMFLHAVVLSLICIGKLGRIPRVRVCFYPSKCSPTSESNHAFFLTYQVSGREEKEEFYKARE